jgi:flagellar biosynthesis/type III secretory pathway chaperone
MDAQRFSRAAKEHLESEEQVLRELLRCLEAERKALVALDGPALARAAAEKEALADRERSLAAARRALIGEAAHHISERTGGSAVDLSLGEILERLRPPGAAALIAQRAQVRSLAARAQRMNALNRELCVHALACLRGYLSLAGHAPTQTYGARGRLVPGTAAGTYARRA